MSTAETDGSDPATDKEETLERLEAAARDRWGDEWTIRAKHFSDDTTQAYAFRSCGVVDNDRDGKTLAEERLYTDGDRSVFLRVHVQREDVVEVLEECELTRD